MGYKYTKTDACGVIIAIAILIFGILMTNFIQSTIPENIEFGPPQIIILMPMIMSAIPLIVCIGLMIRAKTKKQQEGPEVHRYRDETMVYTGDYEIHSEPKSEEDEKVYLIPTNCPSCNSPLSTENIDWVGPLQAKCPHCGAVVDAEERK